MDVIFTPQDLQIKVTDSETLRVHREIIATNSKVLADLLEVFTDDDTKLDIRHLVDDPMHVFERLIMPLAYGRFVDLTQFTVEEQMSALALAVKLDMPDALLKMSDDNLEFDCLWRLLTNLSDYRLQAWSEVPMFKKAVGRVAKELNNYWLSDTSGLPTDFLIEVLRSPDLGVVTEVQLLHIVDAYVNAVKPSDLEVEKLYSSLCFEAFSMPYLISFIQKKNSPDALRRAAETEILNHTVSKEWRQVSGSVKRLTGQDEPFWRRLRTKLSDGTPSTAQVRQRIPLDLELSKSLLLTDTDVLKLKDMCRKSTAGLVYSSVSVMRVVDDNPHRLMSNLEQGVNEGHYDLPAGVLILCLQTVWLRCNFIVTTAMKNSIRVWAGTNNITPRFVIKRNTRKNVSTLQGSQFCCSMASLCMIRDLRISLTVPEHLLTAVVELQLNALVFRSERTEVITVSDD